MGLISRVSSRTYRASNPIFKMATKDFKNKLYSNQRYVDFDQKTQDAILINSKSISPENENKTIQSQLSTNNPSSSLRAAHETQTYYNQNTNHTSNQSQSES